MVNLKRNLTGANYGLLSWLQQRITAIIMLIFVVAFGVFVFSIALSVDKDIASWQGLFHYTLIKILTQLFFVALVLHAWVGIRDLWMDYINSIWIKLFMYILTILWLFASLLYSVKVIWGF